MSQDPAKCSPLSLPDPALTNRPTEAELLELLQLLVNWQEFAHHLLPTEGAGATIEIIKTENKSVADQKLALYTKWLKVDPSATWNKVIDALTKAKEITLAKNVADKKGLNLQVKPICYDVSNISNTQQLSTVTCKDSVTRQVNQTTVRISAKCPIKINIETLHTTFAALVGEIREQLQVITNSETGKLSRIAKFIEELVDVRGLVLTKATDIDELFREIQPHYDFLNCELIQSIVEQFLSEHQLKSDLDKYAQELENFLDSPTLLDLKSAIEEGLIPRQNGTNTTCKVVIKLTGRWGTIPIKTFQAVIRYVFSREFTHIDIKTGSIWVTFLAPLSHSESICHKASTKIDFMNRIGIIEMYVTDDSGDHQYMSPRDEHSVNFSQSLLDAAEAGDDFEVSVLLKLGADVDYQSRERRTALMLASNGGYDQVVQSLISAGANVNIQDNNGYSALMTACEHVHPNLAVLRYLLEAGADPNVLTNDGKTAIVMACQMCHFEAVKLLLSYNADPFLTGRNGNNDMALTAATTDITALMYASWNGHYQIVELLLKEHADVNLQRRDGVTALMIASQNGHYQVVELLLKKQADVNIKTSNETTALMLASRNGHYQVVELLLSQHATNVNVQRQDGVTALMLASGKGHYQVVELLLKQHADVNIQAGDAMTALIFASITGHYQIVELLLSHHAEDTGMIALMHACQNGHYLVVELLLKQYTGVNIQTSTIDGMTALMIVSQNGYYQFVELLLKEHADVNTQTRDGVTALMLASQNGHYLVVELLLKQHADVNIQKGNEATALMLASQNGHHQIVKSLLNEHADVNIQRQDGATALMLASHNGHCQIVELLLNKQADVNIQTRDDGMTALMLARLNGHYQIVQLLQVTQDSNPNIKVKRRLFARTIQLPVRATLTFTTFIMKTFFTEVLRKYIPNLAGISVNV